MIDDQVVDSIKEEIEDAIIEIMTLYKINKLFFSGHIELAPSGLFEDCLIKTNVSFSEVNE